MQGRLAFSLNDDGTVTLRCDADAFFKHADEIRLLLTDGAGEGGEEEPAQFEPPPEELDAFWTTVFPPETELPRSRDLSRKGIEILAAGHYLTRTRGFEGFRREDLQGVFDLLGAARREVKTGTLIHLARRGWLERIRRGAYRLTRRGIDRVESLSQLVRLEPLEPEPTPPDDASSAPLPPEVPSLSGLSRFLREVPTNRKWRRVILVAYFLREHCALEEFDQRIVSACFQRLRGVECPGSLPALISQVLFKRRGLLERGARRGKYRLSASALEELRQDPRVAKADAIHRQTVGVVAKTG